MRRIIFHFESFTVISLNLEFIIPHFHPLHNRIFHISSFSYFHLNLFFSSVKFFSCFSFSHLLQFSVFYFIFLLLSWRGERISMDIDGLYPFIYIDYRLQIYIYSIYVWLTVKRVRMFYYITNSIYIFFLCDVFCIYKMNSNIYPILLLYCPDSRRILFYFSSSADECVPRV